MSSIGFETITQIDTECCSCLTHFSMESRIRDARLRDGKEFYCPLGHSQHYTDTELSRAKEEAEKLRRQNQTLKNQKTWAEQEAEAERRQRIALKGQRRQRIALKGQLTKTRNRIANGVCPCCHRTFKQLASHMNNKHPDFKTAVA